MDYTSTPSKVTGAMSGIFSNSYRAGRHLAMWLLWHSTGVSLLSSERRKR